MKTMKLKEVDMIDKINIVMIKGVGGPSNVLLKLTLINSKTKEIKKYADLFNHIEFTEVLNTITPLRNSHKDTLMFALGKMYTPSSILHLIPYVPHSEVNADVPILVNYAENLKVTIVNAFTHNKQTIVRERDNL